MPLPSDKLPSITLAVTIYDEAHQGEFLAGVDLTEPLTHENLMEKVVWLAGQIGRMLRNEGLIALPMEREETDEGKV